MGGRRGWAVNIPEMVSACPWIQVTRPCRQRPGHWLKFPTLVWFVPTKTPPDGRTMGESGLGMTNVADQGEAQLGKRRCKVSSGPLHLVG